MNAERQRGFTLVELLIVLVIIAVIAALVVGVARLAMQKQARTQADGEIKALGTACESYKADNGVYPRQEGITEQIAGAPVTPIDPRTDGDPSSPAYQQASLFLYQQLWGAAPGASGQKTYIEAKPSILGYDSSHTRVTFLKDPWGNSYGYSTAGAKAEDLYRENARAASGGAPASRPPGPPGYNPTFDLWSTAGTKTNPPTQESQARWLKNWR